jgi:hypothetical protein
MTFEMFTHARGAQTAVLRGPTAVREPQTMVSFAD